jgi:hypothetical protein
MLWGRNIPGPGNSLFVSTMQQAGAIILKRIFVLTLPNFDRCYTHFIHIQNSIVQLTLVIPFVISSLSL